MSNILLRWLEIELSSTVTKRYAISGWPVTYDGDTYNNDGTLISTGDLKFVLDLENTPFEVTLSLTDTDVLNAINDLTYRYRDATLYVGMWDSSNSQIDTDTIKIKNGYVDTHADPTADHTVTFTISSYVNLASQTRTDISASAAHRIKLLEGVFGDSNKNVTDTVFDSVNRDFSQIVLGNIKATSSRIQIGGARPCSRADHWFGSDPIYQTVNTPSSAGVRLENVGELYHTPVAYGKVKVNDQIVNAWNPTESAVTSTYNTVTWNTSTVLANVEEDTKYLSIAYVVAHGPVDSVQMYSNHSDATYNILTAGGGDIQTSYIYANDNSGQGAIAAIDCSRGSFTQTAMPNPIATANGSWDSNDRGIGYCLVVVTMLASDQWPDGLPEFTFIVDSTRIKAITAGGAAATRTKTNGAGEVLYDFMTSAQYGMDLPETFFEVDSFHDFQANAPAIYPNNLRGSVTGPGSYTRFLERMQQSAAVRVYEEDGKIRLWYGQELDDADIAKEFIQDGTAATNCVVTQRNPRSRTVLNEVRGRYFALFDATDELPDNLQKTVIITDTDYLSQDNNIKSTATLDLDFLTLDGDGDGFVDDADRVLVEQVANLKLQKSRLFQEVIITTDYDTASGLKLGDLIRCDVSRYGWEGANRRLFIIREIVYGQGGSVELTCQRHSNTTYGGTDSFSNLDIENQFPVRTNNLVNINDYSPEPSGSSQTNVDIYIRTNSIPLTPTGGSYNFGTGTLTPPAGWSDLPPSGSANLYISRGVAMIDGFTGIDTDIEWEAPRLLVDEFTTQTQIYRFHENNVDDDPGAPTGSNGTGGGWLEESTDPHWEAVTTVTATNREARVVDFDLSGMAADITITPTDTEQEYNYTLSGTLGESTVTRPAQSSIVQYSFTGEAADATSGTFSEFRILCTSGSSDATDTDANPQTESTIITINYDDDWNPSSQQFDLGEQADQEAINQFLLDNIEVENLLVEHDDAMLIDFIDLTYENSGTVNPGEFGMHQDLQSPAVFEYVDAVIPSFDNSTNTANGSYPFVRLGVGDIRSSGSFPNFSYNGRRTYGIFNFDSEQTAIDIQELLEDGNYLFVGVNGGTDGDNNYGMYQFDADEIYRNGSLLLFGNGVSNRGSQGSSGDSSFDGSTVKVTVIDKEAFVGSGTERADNWDFDSEVITYDHNPVKITYQIAGQQTAPTISIFREGTAENTPQFTITTLEAGDASIGTATRISVTDGTTTSTYDAEDVESNLNVVGDVISLINENYGSAYTATGVTNVVTVTSNDDTADTLTVTVTTGTNSSDGVSDNDLAVTSNQTQIGRATAVQVGQSTSISVEIDDSEVANVVASDDDTLLQLVAALRDAIDGDSRYTATSSSTTINVKSTFEGIDPTIELTSTPGADTDGVAATFAITTGVVSNGNKDVQTGTNSSFSVTVGTEVIASAQVIDDTEALASIADKIADAINDNTNAFSAGDSGSEVRATSIEADSDLDIFVTIIPGENADGTTPTLAVAKTVVQEGSSGTFDLTNATWTYFVINHEIVVDTDLLTFTSSDNMIGVNRGLILDSTAYNVVATSGTADLGTHVTGDRPAHLVFTGGAGLLGTTDTDLDDSVMFVRIEFSTDGGVNYETLATSVTFNFSTDLANFGDFITPVLPVSVSTDADPNTTYTLRARLLTSASTFPSNVSGNFTFNGILFEELRAAS